MSIATLLERLNQLRVPDGATAAESGRYIDARSSLVGQIQSEITQEKSSTDELIASYRKKMIRQAQEIENLKRELNARASSEGSAGTSASNECPCKHKTILASQIIDRTFDTHMRMLRSKLRDAQAQARRLQPPDEETHSLRSELERERALNAVLRNQVADLIADAHVLKVQQRMHSGVPSSGSQPEIWSNCLSVVMDVQMEYMLGVVETLEGFCWTLLGSNSHIPPSSGPLPESEGQDPMEKPTIPPRKPIRQFGGPQRFQRTALEESAS
jgi:hypothetical protein